MHADGTRYGRDGDHCPHCGHDWRAPHDEDCPRYHACEFPPGCPDPAAPGYRLCRRHYADISALFGKVDA